MTDPIERLRGANPVSELPSRSLAELWQGVHEHHRPGPSQDGGDRSAPPSPGRHLPGLSAIVLTFSTLTAVAIAVLAIVLIHHGRQGTGTASRRSAPRVTTRPGPGELPTGVAIGPSPRASNTVPGAVVPGTVGLLAQSRDPAGGLSWGMRAFKTDGGETCLQTGRAQDGVIGVIGQDGAWHDDHRFHPVDPNATEADFCAETDRSGDAFENVMLESETASGGAGLEELHFQGCGIPGQPHGVPCRRSNLRVVQYGLLGPDAASITYLSANGRPVTEPTVGARGAYLIVERASKRVCRRASSQSGCDHEAAGGAYAVGSSLSAGLITAVHYQGGRVCHVPAQPPAGTPAGTPQRSCAPVGYRAPLAAHITAADLATPITARQLPSRHTVEITFKARVAVSSDNSLYKYVLTPSSYGTTGCSNQGGDDTAQATSGGGYSPHLYIRAGRRVVLQDQIKAHCTGTLNGTVAYVPNLGPQGIGYPGFIPSDARSITVGHFSLTIR